MILIKNEQENIDFDSSTLKKQAEKILEHLGYQDFDLGILLTTNDEIQKYNREFRKKDKPTDILSFPYHTELKAGDRIKPEVEEDKNLGDIIISLEFVKKDAPERWSQTLEERMPILLAHGICHLLGYDHIKDEDYQIMKKQEKTLLNQIFDS